MRSQEEREKELLDAMKDLTRLIISTEEPRQCKASPYKFTLVLDWKTILAIAISLIATLDKLITNLAK